MSTLNNIMAQIKQKEEQINAVSLDEMKKAEREKNKASMQADIDVSNAGYNSQISNTQAVYDKRIGDTKTAYESEYQKNAVQKLINEKKIAEANANLGLTDSGLNRTQQTAAQLSYANQKGKIDIVRQSALDTLGLELTNAITTLQNQKSAAERDITNNWNSYSDNMAQNAYNTKIGALVDERNALAEQYSNMYNAQVKADAEVKKEAIKASVKNNATTSLIRNSIISRNYQGTLEDNNIKWAQFTDDDGIQKVKYVDVSTGDTLILDWGQNPYTLDQNLASWNKNETAIAAKIFGVYSHGYQPKGLCVSENGKQKCYEFESAKNVYIEKLGRYQNIYTANGKTWIWNDAGNKYVECTINNGQFDAPDWVW